MPPTNRTQSTRTIRPLAGLLALVLPGLGHAASGRAARGLIAGGCVLGMLLGGLLIGGVDAIDSREDRPWFIGQALVGPIVLGIDAFHQSVKAYPVRNARPGENGLSRRRGPDVEGPAFAVSQRDLDLGLIRPRNVGPDERREIVDVLVFRGTASPDADVRRLPVAVPLPEGETAQPPIGEALGKLNEIAMLYILCAGLLNLIIFFDALIPGALASEETRGSIDRENTA